ncbi:LuxR C-terminal-related transcriptional regulator [Kribbella sp. NPDC050470]|uniref:LuxR C-terminal-related transcriptional regulator n=1 Tax=unclassified Kribbella TaxID=2644121 RepID=UPI0037A02C8C
METASAARWAAGLHSPTLLVGRDSERAALQRIILGSARLVTLTGSGGTGKTRLALAVVGDVRSGFRDGVWPVELAPLSEPTQVAGAVAAACRAVSESDTQPAIDLRDRLRDRELLLVLDNCEHVADGVAELLRFLLPDCPGLKVLATSRQALQIYGERLYPVRPLSLVSSLHVPLAEIAEIPSIALFVQRARAVVPDFSLTAENVGDVAEICRLVDGLPLAIELAATRLGLFSPRALLARLRDGIDILRRGLADVPPRQQTMRAAILWSYQLLTEPERKLLTSLGVFVDGFSVAAAMAVARLPQDRVENLLESLLDKGMLAASVGVDGEPRFQPLHTIQAFCVERLRDTSDEEVVRSRHADYFAGLVAKAEKDLAGGRHAACMARLVCEQANLRAAYRHLRARGDANGALAFATGLWRFMFGQGHLREGLRLLEEALGDECVRTQDRRHADALHAAGTLAMAVGDYVAAEAYQRRAVEAYRALGEVPGLAAALNHLGNLARIRGDFAAARKLCGKSLSLWREAKDRRGAAVVLIDMAMISLSRGDVAAADEAVGFALPLVEAHGDERSARSVRALAGLIAFRRGDQQEAERTCRAAAAGVVDMGTHPDTPFALEALALVLAGRKQPDTDLAAVRLIAAASSVRAETHSYACAEVLPYVDRALQNLRGRLGDVAFDNACIAGKTLPLGALLDERVGVVEAPAPAKEAGAGEAADADQRMADALLEAALTAREREVVVLVAEGMTNRQIASTLKISEWTAINHVRHAMRKLGVPSRVHVAQWATRQQL